MRIIRVIAINYHSGVTTSGSRGIQIDVKRSYVHRTRIKSTYHLGLKFGMFTMSHIEFLGPPGAGKSTIFSQLTASKEFYGGVKGDAIHRMFLEKSRPIHQIVYRVMPQPVREFLEHELLESQFKYGLLEEFVHEYPNFIDALSMIMNAVSYEQERVFSFYKRLVEQYQLGTATVDEKETLCLDEGFAQRALAALWRDPDRSISLKKYFDTVPMPELIVHVDAPPEICLNRQHERENLVVAKDWEVATPMTVQRNLQELCSDVSDYLSEETSVMTLDNTGSVAESVKAIQQQMGALA